MKLNFKNKTALVTGGEGGIGKAICEKFISLGAKVIVTTTKAKRINNKFNNRTYMHLDFNNKTVFRKFLVNLKKIKKIDILVNNAGINKLASIDKIEETYLEKIYGVNLKGPIIMTKEISKIMMKNQSGKIVNISSIFGTISKSERSLYSSTKSGIIGLTKSSALDLAKYNILVNSVSPGVIKTNLTSKILNSRDLKKIKKEIPLGRLGKPSEVSDLVCFLCSDFNNYITGQDFIIDGGYTSK